MQKLMDSHIKKFLETAPLYTWSEFGLPNVNRGSLWIGEIDAYCKSCGQNRPFQDLRSRGSGAGSPPAVLKTGTSYFYFTCVSCRKEHREYLVEQTLDHEAGTIKFQKYGELPRKEIERDRNLQKFFKDDMDNYEKAVVCLTHGYGIGAFAYLRRIVENNISHLLDLLLEEAQATKEGQDVIDAIDELRKESPMSDKIKLANQALPSYLKPEGLNPLGKLYQVLSEGVHNLSDEECLNKAKAARECIAFLVAELASRRQHREQFKKIVGDL